MKDEAIKALLREMQYVLDSIDRHVLPIDGDDFHEAIRLGKEALAQPPLPVQEPTGMLHIDRLGQWLDASLKDRKRPWVELTDEEIREIHSAAAGKDVGFATGLTEAKLKDKNNG
jgi:hypothetical protein